MPLSVVILAAGQGKRMKSDLPKVLQPLAGRPMLEHVIRCARELDPAAIHVVYGHGGERVREALSGQPVSQPGDWFGSVIVKPAENGSIALSIDTPVE